MSGIGRGKGRGFAEVRETTLRRPGQALSSKFKDLLDLVDRLTIEDLSLETKTDELIQMVNNSIKNGSIKEVFDDLHKQALEDKQFGIKLVIAFCGDKAYCCGETRLRSIFLQLLQNDYEAREKIKEKSIVHFHNAISLLGEVYNSFSINGKPYLRILTIPLLQYFEMLLEASQEDDIKLTFTQICMNGRKIHDMAPAPLEDFMMKVRSTLINRNLSSLSRGLLLHIIDLSNQGFAPLSGKTQELYVAELGIHNLSDAQHLNKDPTVNTKIENNVNDKDSAQSFNRLKNKPVAPSTDISVGRLMTWPKHGKNPDVQSPPSAGSEKPSVPRAIRGAGAAEGIKDKNAKKSPRGKKDKLTDEQICSLKQNTSSKVWGHDDRFDKDYA